MRFVINNLPSEDIKKVKELLAMWLYERVKNIFGSDEIYIEYYLISGTKDIIRFSYGKEFSFSYEGKFQITIKENSFYGKISEDFDKMGFEDIVAKIEKWLEKVKFIKEEWEKECVRVDTYLNEKFSGIIDKLIIEKMKEE